MKLIWASATHPGRVRSNNEDRAHPAAAGSGKKLLAIVADGMGGHVGGEVASRVAIEAATGQGHSDPGQRVKAGNGAVLEKAASDPELSGMGTTMTLVDLVDGTARIAHVGDSRCYLIRDGDMRRLTRDHTVATEYLERGTITPEEVATHPQRHVLTRALGLQEKVTVDEFEEPVEPGDRLLLCSDGLNGMINDDQIFELARAGTPEEAVWSLIEGANSAGGFDNITVVIVDVDQ